MSGTQLRIEPISRPNGSRALPRQRERDEARRAGRGLDDEAVRCVRRALAPCAEEGQRARRLRRPPPHRDVALEPRGDHRDRVEPEVAPGHRVVEARLRSRIERRPERPRGKDDLRSADLQAMRRAVGRDRAAHAGHAAGGAQDRLDGGVGHDPRAEPPGVGEMHAQAAPLGAAPAAELAAPAVPAADPVAGDGRGLEAERVTAVEQQLVLGRHVRRRTGLELAWSMASRSASHSCPSMPSTPCSRAQCRRVANGASIVVSQFTSVPPPTPAPASVTTAPSHEVVMPWLRYSRSKAVSSSVGISGSGTNGPASRTMTERPARARSAATTPPAAPDPTTTTSASSWTTPLRGIGRAARGHDRRGLGGDRLRCPREPEPQQERIAAILAGVRVGEEREQALERLVGSPLAAEARARPAVQVPLPGRRRQVAEADGAACEREVEERRARTPAGRGGAAARSAGVHGGLVALDGEPGAASGAAAHERLRHGSEGLELGGGPAPGQGGVGVRHGRGRRPRRRERWSGRALGGRRLRGGRLGRRLGGRRRGRRGRARPAAGSSAGRRRRERRCGVASDAVGGAVDAVRLRRGRAAGSGGDAVVSGTSSSVMRTVRRGGT